MNPYIFLISGPSGCGKNSVIEGLLKKNSSIRLLASCTSRTMRTGEHQGNPYFFMSRSEFEDHIDHHQFLEWKVIHQHNYYGIRKDDVLNILNTNTSIIKDIDILGSFDLRRYFPNQVVPIFIDAPSKTDLISRLKNRKESDTNIQKRLKRYDIEILYKNHFLHQIQNVYLDKTCIQLEQLIQQYQTGGCRPDVSKLYHPILFTIRNTRNQILQITSKNPDSTSTLIKEYQLKTETVMDAVIRKLKFAFYPFKINAIQSRILQTQYTQDKLTYDIEIEIESKLDTSITSENFELKWITPH